MNLRGLPPNNPSRISLVMTQSKSTSPQRKSRQWVYRWTNLWYAFPVQLVLFHLRSNLLLFLIWIALFLLINGDIAAKFGFRYLFLDPEYYGQTGFWSFFFLGLAFGCYFLIWNLTSYLLCAQNFPFLATLAQPFTKFCWNNFLIPLGFFSFYAVSIILFQGRFIGAPAAVVLADLAGLTLGFFGLLLLYLLYFRYTNYDIAYFEKKQSALVSLLPHITPGYRTLNWEHAKVEQARWRVDFYLSEWGWPRRVRSVMHYNVHTLQRIFRQNQLNALAVQLLTIFMLTALGWLIDWPGFKIPAGASIFFLCSIVVAAVGAVSYWFQQWRMLAMLLLLIGINYLTGFDAVHRKNRAYGLDYQEVRATYQLNSLRQASAPEQVARDKAATLQILERWKQQQATRGESKPKLVLICVSGGGLRAVLWAMKVVQTADSLLAGRLLQHTALITGASGGMMGMAYLRELLLQKKLGANVDLYSAEHRETMTKDLLNGVAFTLVANDLFWPWSHIRVNEKRYTLDRGYVFEKQLNENTAGLLDKTLADYRGPEQEAIIPLLYLTPAIVNDVRRLVISPQPVAFMMASPGAVDRLDQLELDAVDFRALFAGQQPDSLRFLSALRMNATFPFVLPSVNLPSQPAIEVMDAGFLDNYGLLGATRFLEVFRDWIKANTSGVVLVQVSSSEKFDSIAPSNRKGIIGTMLNPFAIAGQMLNRQEYEQDNLLGSLHQSLGPGFLDLAHFIYRPGQGNRVLASISWHITAKEKASVLAAWTDPGNQAAMEKIIRLFTPPP